MGGRLSVAYRMTQCNVEDADSESTRACVSVYLRLLVSRQHGVEREDKQGEVDHILQRVKVKSQTQSPTSALTHHGMSHTNTLVWPARPNFHFRGCEVASCRDKSQCEVGSSRPDYTHLHNYTELKQNTQ